RALGRARGLGLVEGIDREKHPVLYELVIGSEPSLELEIDDVLAARLVDASPYRLRRKRHRDGRRRAALDKQIARFTEQPAEADRMAIVEPGHVGDGVRGQQRAEFELDELARRLLEFELRLGSEEPPGALAERRNGLGRDFLFA